MSHKHNIREAEGSWDSRKLGADEEFVKPLESDPSDEEAIDAAFELQPISIRLQKTLIEDFKLIAQLHGIGYQPLMRQVLTRFADSEKKRILREVACDMAKRQKGDSVEDGEDEQIIAACG